MMLKLANMIWFSYASNLAATSIHPLNLYGLLGEFDEGGVGHLLLPVPLLVPLGQDLLCLGHHLLQGHAQREGRHITL
jgi:hypothetical protein